MCISLVYRCRLLLRCLNQVDVFCIDSSMTTLLFLVLDEKQPHQSFDSLVTGTYNMHTSNTHDVLVFLLLIEGVVFSSSTKNNNVVMQLSVF